ncbi:MAG TPA: hypothetical protein VML58_05660 [Burkholderiaceae bacterium]|nr:hypothetical protein [Burkholderiaceae bacterium]
MATKPIQWLARVLGLDAGSDTVEDVVSFEYVDGSRLAADEFHQSDSMRLDEANVRDFAETLPTFSHRAATPPYAPRQVAMHGQRVH